jgi:PilZ domain-containing protein
MQNQPAKLGPQVVASNPSERRRTVRYPFTSSIEVTDVKTLTKVIGRTSDIGRGGCYVDVISPLPEGTAVKVRLALEQRTFEAQAKVVYSQNGMGMGIAFLSATPENLKVLDGWIAVLSGVAPTEPAAAEAPRRPASPPQKREGEASGDLEPKFVLNELIITLMRKCVLSETEGKSLLQKLMS